MIAIARRVQITFTNGTYVTVPTIAPPAPLNPGIRFYIARRPCHAMFTRIIALVADDRVVATETGPSRSARPQRVRTGDVLANDGLGHLRSTMWHTPTNGVRFRRRAQLPRP